MKSNLAAQYFSKQQAASSKQQAASSKQQAASSKQQAASSKQQASNNSVSVKPAKNSRLFAKSSGFTIIEVALVLAIAGLIFLVVFLALPALQKSQRNTARRQDVAKGVVAMQQYYADGGSGLDFDTAQACTGSYQLPLKSDSRLGQYLVNAGFSSQTTGDKILKYGDTGCVTDAGSWTSAPELGVVDFFVGKKCVAPKDTGGYGLTEAGSPLYTAVTVRLEVGTATGTPGAVMYCADASR